MWFRTENVSLKFTTTSPFRFENSIVLDAPPARVFEIWATGEAQTEWFKDLVDIRWSNQERGVGAEREVELKTSTVRERFLAWEPDKRLAFVVYGITLPIVKAMLEDLTFEPVGQNQTRMVWTAHYAPTLLMRLIHPLGRFIFGRIFSDATAGLQRYIKDHPTRPLKN